MKMAIEKAYEGIKSGNTPFGACIVKDENIISCEHNIVWQSTDITAHAEINAIRVACKKLNSIDLSGCSIYSTCEPCPMCFSACHWAKIDKIIFGTEIKDAQIIGFNELTVSNDQMKSIGKSKIEIVKHFMYDENLKLFKDWAALKNKKVY
ncbi:TPA: nucleoside deaminase [Candidatus Dependentiae bacterium]|nr:MAG: hypothetical protein UR14_C0005G0089 [candidate division TM6 bacterium GW2011_GWE2_31_21]KKP53166.1 MAG: hypothetical protein UR43_C0007G0090 [candidate division TM6 bacterium GW2011_GWF2_33_332]HBS47985.1 nucleoside deaminase [Candidatus Dependentiae bacterium]HBZ73411.1 nucleoside deaminase [Candidatus Dependentiae bacterium]